VAALRNGKIFGGLITGCAFLVLQACVTARMHTKAELNSVEQSCGLAVGELIQDESEKRLLILFRVGATAEERSCVSRWARRNHLHLSVIEGVNFEDR
jgi:hypothetical protein